MTTFEKHRRTWEFVPFGHRHEALELLSPVRGSEVCLRLPGGDVDPAVFGLGGDRPVQAQRDEPRLPDEVLARRFLQGEHDVDSAIDAAGQGHVDAAARVEAMIAALGEASVATLPLGRSLIRLTVDAPSPPATQPREPKRGYRRVAWIERALEPMRNEVDDDVFEQLVSALAMVLGWEALVVLEDLRSLDRDDQVRTSTWAARALIHAALDEQAARRTESKARTPARNRQGS